MPNTCCLMGVWMRSLSRSGLALRGDQPLGGITCSKLGESEQKQLCCGRRLAAAGEQQAAARGPAAPLPSAASSMVCSGQHFCQQAYSRSKAAKGRQGPGRCPAACRPRRLLITVRRRPPV